MSEANDLVRKAERLRANVNAMLKYWAIYKQSFDYPGMDRLVEDGDADAIFTVRVGMLRLTVLNVRRALEPARHDRWSMLSILKSLESDSAAVLLNQPALVDSRDTKCTDDCVKALEQVRPAIEDIYHSSEAEWIRALRDDDIAHSTCGSDLWQKRSREQLDSFVLSAADQAFRLINLLVSAPSGSNAYRFAEDDARAFWARLVPQPSLA